MLPKVLICSVLSSFVFGPAAFADFESASAAFQRGDYGLAFTEFRILADQGDAEAQYVLGHMFQLGTGIAQSDAKALTWFTAAAETGHRGAQNSLGFIYFTGIGTGVDLLKAHYWFSRAAEQGDVISQRKRDEIAAELAVAMDEVAVDAPDRSDDPLNVGTAGPNEIAPAAGPMRAGPGLADSLAIHDALKPLAPLRWPEPQPDQPDERPLVAMAPIAAPPLREKLQNSESANPVERPTTDSAAALPGTYWVQLGAFRVAENAPAAWRGLRHSQARWLGPVGHEIRRVDARSGGDIHLLWAGPLKNREAANELCRNLSADGVDCLVIKR